MNRKLYYSLDDDSNDLVKKYEQFLLGTASGYFDVEELESIVDYYLGKGRTKDGEKALELGLKLHPFSTALQTKRAKIFLAIGDAKKAFRILDSLTVSADYEVILLKIEALIKLNRDKEAEILSNNIFAEEIEDIDNICLDLSFVYFSQLNFEIALKYLLKGDNFNPKNVDLLFELAYCYEQLDDYQSAIIIYNRIIDVDSYIAEAWFNLGQVYFSQLDYKNALDAYDFSLAINENDSIALLQKAHSLFQLELYNEAIKFYQEFNETAIDKWQAKLFIGESYEKLEKYDEALINYNQSLEEYPKNYDALTGIGICLLEKEQYIESMTYIRKALELNEDAPDAWVYLAEGYIGIDDTDNALLAYLNSITLDPNQPDTLIAVANICMDNEQYETALQYYHTAYEMDNTLEYIHLFLAVAFFKTKDVVSSSFYLKKAIEQSLDSKKLFYEICPDAKDID